MKKRFDELLRRGFALLLCLCVVVGCVPVPTFAEVDPHHPVHTADCGYAEAVPASPCTTPRHSRRAKPLRKSSSNRLFITTSLRL